MTSHDLSFSIEKQKQKQILHFYEEYKKKIEFKFTSIKQFSLKFTFYIFKCKEKKNFAKLKKKKSLSIKLTFTIVLLYNRKSRSTDRNF